MAHTIRDKTKLLHRVHRIRGQLDAVACQAPIWNGLAPVCFSRPSLLPRWCYSAPIWVPFAATERRMSRTRPTNRTATAADARKTSKYARANAC